ncbi:hypothetical protein COOONC_03451 [Cooperia oncophora]
MQSKNGNVLNNKESVLTRHSRTFSHSLVKYSTLGDDLNLEDRNPCKPCSSPSQREIRECAKRHYWVTSSDGELDRKKHATEERKLHNQPSTITAQLVSEGESLHSTSSLSKTLTKFTERIQNNTLEEKVSSAPTETWTLMKLMITLLKRNQTARNREAYAQKIGKFAAPERIGANVHDQPLTNLQTFNYLLHSLQGEARDVNKRYAVNDDNYEDAISPSQTTHGDSSKLIPYSEYNAQKQKVPVFTPRGAFWNIIPTISQLEKEQTAEAATTNTVQEHTFSPSPPMTRDEIQQQLDNLENSN